MKHFLALLALLSASAALAQTYSGGLPINITTSNPSVGTNGAAAPTSSNQIGGRNESGRLTPLIIGNQGITVAAYVTGGVAITSTANNVVQGTIPWVTTAAITNTPTVNQGTSPWVTSRNWVLNGLADSVGVTGTVAATQGTSPWYVNGGVAITATANVAVPGGVGITSTVSSASTTVTRTANSASSQTLLAANANRKGAIFFNDAATTACYVKFGATASTNSFTIKLYATDTYIMDPPIYTGVIDYICDAASGSMEASEL